MGEGTVLVTNAVLKNSPNYYVMGASPQSASQQATQPQMGQMGVLGEGGWVEWGDRSVAQANVQSHRGPGGCDPKAYF